MSASEAAQLYVNVKPLFDQAYIELGHQGGDFDTAIVRAIEALGDTPDRPETPSCWDGRITTSTKTWDCAPCPPSKNSLS